MNWKHDHTPRLSTWDYSRGGAYFVTFKVQDRAPVLGTVADGVVTPTVAGGIVEECWHALPEEFPVLLDLLVIMPDHMHAILMLEAADALPGHSADRGFRPLMAEPGASLGKLIRSWKGRATFRIRQTVDTRFAWQSRYYDRVIRNSEELDLTREYIRDNPTRWSRGRGSSP